MRPETTHQIRTVLNPIDSPSQVPQGRGSELGWAAVVRDAQRNNDRNLGSCAAVGYYCRRGHRGQPHHEARTLGLLHDRCRSCTGHNGMDTDQGVRGQARQFLLCSPGKERCRVVRRVLPRQGWKLSLAPDMKGSTPHPQHGSLQTFVSAIRQNVLLASPENPFYS